VRGFSSRAAFIVLPLAATVACGESRQASGGSVGGATGLGAHGGSSGTRSTAGTTGTGGAAVARAGGASAASGRRPGSAGTSAAGAGAGVLATGGESQGGSAASGGASATSGKSGGATGGGSHAGEDGASAGAAGELGTGGEQGDLSREHALWPMPNPPSSGLPHPQAYTKSSDMIADRVTGLVWERRSASGTYTFAEAADRCASLTTGGFDDWRTPTMIELYSLIDWTKYPTIDPDVIPDVTTDGAPHWSASPFGSMGFVVNLAFGTMYTALLDEANLVRCVRAGNATAHRFAIEGGTLSEAATGLAWEHSAGTTVYSYAAGDADAYCANLVLDGHDDWRLPGVGELATLVEVTTSQPALDRSKFPDEVGLSDQGFWAHHGWTLSFDIVYALEGSAAGHRVRCVR